MKILGTTKQLRKLTELLKGKQNNTCKNYAYGMRMIKMYRYNYKNVDTDKQEMKIILG